MATAAESTLLQPGEVSFLQPGQRLFTAADLAAMSEQLPSGPVSFELHHGRLVPMSTPGALHGNLQSRIGAALYTHGEEKGHGKSYTGVGIVLARKPDDVRGADAAFVTKRSLSARETPEGFFESVPDSLSKSKARTTHPRKRLPPIWRPAQKVVWVLESAHETVVEQTAPMLGHKPTLRPPC